MPKIYSEKEPLAIDRVTIAKPVNKNGAHFIKTLDVDDPIYFLAPKCFVKQGFVNHGKKAFCDFVFSNDNSEFFSWLENLEEKVKSGIYENREKWFETPLDEHDIESSMTPPYKPYKSGKFFIIRANVPTALGKINIKVYDEHENETEPESIKENTKVLAVLEFQGIRCGVRSFQFEIELKQILIVEPEKIFEKCVIASVKSGDGNPSISNSRMLAESVPISFANGVAPTQPLETIESQESELPIKQDEEHPSSRLEDVSETPTVLGISSEELNHPSDEVEILVDNFPLDNLIEFVADEPPIRLKSRNDVYYKLYKDTRRRAREAKQEALANYLEAKRIKTTYLLETTSDSDSDLDELGAATKH
jgi:hypothetical protein